MTVSVEMFGLVLGLVALLLVGAAVLSVGIIALGMFVGKMIAWNSRR